MFFFWLPTRGLRVWFIWEGLLTDGYSRLHLQGSVSPIRQEGEHEDGPVGRRVADMPSKAASRSLAALSNLPEIGRLGQVHLSMATQDTARRKKRETKDEESPVAHEADDLGHSAIPEGSHILFRPQSLALSSSVPLAVDVRSDKLTDKCRFCCEQMLELSFLELPVNTAYRREDEPLFPGLKSFSTRREAANAARFFPAVQGPDLLPSGSSCSEWAPGLACRCAGPGWPCW
ncbi:hypothetical protein QBC37DRAFT_395891 [Rhypophila decipiens]|uniref:Uncharacterized protein n=1 Tax=Rhypophila decipiens TaxID=261697 RepID=A0AAN6YGK2_9PEZI|nr:hypothetical protein QBC37DRAFT_395891 [Rhypophila decipiens]